MKRGLEITLGLILLSFSLFGCAHNSSKEKGNPRGIIPYVLKDFDKKYAPRAEDNLEEDKDYTLPSLEGERTRMLKNIYMIEF